MYRISLKNRYRSVIILPLPCFSRSVSGRNTSQAIRKIFMNIGLCLASFNPLIPTL